MSWELKICIIIYEIEYKYVYSSGVQYLWLSYVWVCVLLVSMLHVELKFV